jgi:AraC-like DNA-binding protein
MAHFTHIAAGRQKVRGGARHARHRHTTPYAAIILRGGYEEAGERGRVKVGEGDIVLHDAFDAHCDLFEPKDCEILNLPLPLLGTQFTITVRSNNVDAIIRTAERDMQEAVSILLQSLEPTERRRGDWQDELAAELWRQQNLSLNHWARAHNMAPATVSRGFAHIYGVTPARFRADTRTRRAWEMLLTDDAPLSEVSHRAGYADQAHFTREVMRLTGRTPGAWRKSNLFNTSPAC